MSFSITREIVQNSAHKLKLEGERERDHLKGQITKYSHNLVMVLSSSSPAHQLPFRLSSYRSQIGSFRNIGTLANWLHQTRRFRSPEDAATGSHSRQSSLVNTFAAVEEEDFANIGGDLRCRWRHPDNAELSAKGYIRCINLNSTPAARLFATVPSRATLVVIVSGSYYLASYRFQFVGP